MEESLCRLGIFIRPCLPCQDFCHFLFFFLLIWFLCIIVYTIWDSNYDVLAIVKHFSISCWFVKRSSVFSHACHLGDECLHENPSLTCGTDPFPLGHRVHLLNQTSDFQPFRGGQYLSGFLSKYFCSSLITSPLSEVLTPDGVLSGGV